MSLIDGRIKIVYVDRQGTNRKLSPDAHTGLVAVLQRLQSSPYFVEDRTAQIEVQIAKFEDMSAEIQIQSAYDADIFIGVHGNGLSECRSVLFFQPSILTHITLV